MSLTEWMLVGPGYNRRIHRRIDASQISDPVHRMQAPVWQHYTVLIYLN